MKLKLLLFTILLSFFLLNILAGCKNSTINTNAKIKSYRKDNLNNIYETAIMSVSKEKKAEIIVENETLSISDIDEDWNKLSKKLLQNLPNLTKDVINNFHNKNFGNDFLTKEIIYSPIFILVDQQSSKKIRENGWLDFYSQHPNADGLYKVSKVGFSDDDNLALVYIHRQSGYNIGEGFFILLKKDDEKWVINEKYLWSVS